MAKIVNIAAIIGLIAVSIVSIYFTYQGAMVIIDSKIIAMILSVSISVAVSIFSYQAKKNKGFLVALFVMMSVSILFNFSGKITHVNEALQKNETLQSETSDQKLTIWQQAVKQHEIDRQNFIKGNIETTKKLNKTELDALQKNIDSEQQKVNKIKRNIAYLEKQIKRGRKPKTNTRKLKIAKKSLTSSEKAITDANLRKIEINKEIKQAANIPYNVPAPIKPTLQKTNDKKKQTNNKIKEYLSYLLSLISDLLAALFSASIAKTKEDETTQRDIALRELKAENKQINATSRATSQALQLQLNEVSQALQKEQLKASALSDENERLKQKIKQAISEQMAVAKIKQEALEQQAQAQAILIKQRAKKSAEKAKLLSAKKILGMIKHREFIPDTRLKTVSIKLICKQLGNNSRSAQKLAKQAVDTALENGFLVRKGNSTAYPKIEITPAKLHAVA